MTNKGKGSLPKWVHHTCWVKIFQNEGFGTIHALQVSPIKSGLPRLPWVNFAGIKLWFVTGSLQKKARYCLDFLREKIHAIVFCCYLKMQVKKVWHPFSCCLLGGRPCQDEAKYLLPSHQKSETLWRVNDGKPPTFYETHRATAS